MLIMIHQILVKKLNKTCEVLSTIDDYWSNRQMSTAILASLFISFQIKSCTMLLACWWW